MLKRGTWLLLLSAIALTGGVLLLENNSGSDTASTAENETATASLFPFEEEAIEQFSVVRELPEDESEGDNELSFVKGDDGSWEMTVPEAAIAQNGAIAFLLSQVTTTNARPVEIESGSESGDESASLEPYGLEDPIATVSLTADGNDYQLHIGGLDFAGDQRYVQAVDKGAASDVSASNIYLVSGGITTAIDRPTEDWLLADETTPAEDTEEDTEEADTEEADIENPLPEESVEDISEDVDGDSELEN